MHYYQNVLRNPYVVFLLNLLWQKKGEYDKKEAHIKSYLNNRGSMASAGNCMSDFENQASAPRWRHVAR